MSQTNTTTKTTTVGNGSTTAFSWPYPIRDASDVTVVLVTHASGAEAVQTITTHYTVAIDSDYGGATITFLTAPPATKSVIIYRTSALTQESTYARHNSIEGDLDTQTQQNLTLQEQIDRAIKIPVGDDTNYNSRTPVTTLLPTVEGADAGDSIKLNSTKTGLEWGTGAGDVNGPASSTDNAIVRWHGTDGDNIQNSGAILDDSDNVTGLNNVTIDGVLTAGSGATVVTNSDGTVNLEALEQDGASTNQVLAWNGTDWAPAAASSGDVTAGANITANRVVIGDDGAKGIKESVVTIADSTGNTSGVGTLGCGAITTTGELHMNGASIGHTNQTATGDGTTTIDWGAGNLFLFQFGAFSETFTFTAPTNPGTFILVMTQDSVGSRTATWPASVKWPGGTAPTLTTTATTGKDIIHFVYDGTNYYGTSAADFS